MKRLSLIIFLFLCSNQVSAQLKVEFIGPNLKNVVDVVKTKDKTVFLTDGIGKNGKPGRPTTFSYKKGTSTLISGKVYFANKIPKEYINANQLNPLSNGGFALCSDKFAAILNADQSIKHSWFSDGSVYDLRNYLAAAEGKNHYIFAFWGKSYGEHRGYLRVNKSTFKAEYEDFKFSGIFENSGYQIFPEGENGFVSGFYERKFGRMAFEKITPKTFAFSSGGTREWHFHCGKNYASYSDFIKVKDGNYVAVMKVDGNASYNKTDFQDEILIRKFTPDGTTILWDKYFVIVRDLHPAPIYGESVENALYDDFEIVENEQGGFYLIASSGLGYSKKGEEKTIIYKLGPKGDLLATKFSKEIKFMDFVHYNGNGVFEGQTDKGWVRVTF
jgi:hypothetical protein